MIFEEKKIDSAAVASTQAAEHYQLNILKRNIETDDENFTRFVIISKIKFRQLENQKLHLFSQLNMLPAHYKIVWWHFQIEN